MGRAARDRRLIAYVTEQQKSELEEVARETGVTVSVLVSMAVSDFLARRKVARLNGEYAPRKAERSEPNG